jgi:tetratricopeptide (TPR) repeat protein
MKTRNFYTIGLFVMLLSLFFINFKNVRSSYFQAFLMYDFNSDSYTLPYEQYSNKLDDNFPNLTRTTLPIKFMKARYLLKLDSLDTTKKLLYAAIKDNPYIKGPEQMLARIFLEEKNIDSAYYYSNEAFYEMPNVVAHRYTFFRVLQQMNDSVQLDRAFKIIKERSDPSHWYDYIYTKFKINNKNDELLSLIEEFKEKFPNEDFATINEISSFIKLGSEAFTLSAALSALGDSKFLEEDYIEAAKLYEKAIDFNKNEYLYFENAAISYDLSNNYSKALEYYNVVIDNFKSSDGRAEFYKGLMLIRTDKPVEGCRILEVASRKKFILKNDGLSALLVFQQLCLNNPNN